MGIVERFTFFGPDMPFTKAEDKLMKGGNMLHGPHHDCLMCGMAKTVGMMEKHPKDCDCEVHPKKEGKEDEQKSESKVSASLGM